MLENLLFLQVDSTCHGERVEVRLLVLIGYTAELPLFFVVFWGKVTCKLK